MKWSVCIAIVLLALVASVHCFGNDDQAVSQLNRPKFNQGHEKRTSNRERAACPGGFFRVGTSQQCYKIYKDVKRNWNDASAKCKAENLRLAHPEDPVAVRKLLVETYGIDHYTWVGAQGNGTSQIWQSGVELSNKSPYWWWPSTVPSSQFSSTMCLQLATTNHFLKKSPNKPYYALKCHSHYWTLCEKLAACPGGFFRAGTSQQCYKIYKDVKRNWNDASAKCEAENMRLAHPQDPVAVRKLLVETYGIDHYTWVGAQGNGTSQIWQSGEVLSNTSPYWWHSTVPSSAVSSTMCLELDTTNYWLNNSPNRPYFSQSCQDLFWTLCERCPPESKGFTIPKGTNRCYKVFTDKPRNWFDARSKCQHEGLVMAKIAFKDALNIRDHLIEKYGSAGYGAWLAARGNGNQQCWNDGEPISNNNPLYWITQSHSWATDHCLMLLNFHQYQRDHPSRPFFPTSCKEEGRHAFCELV